MRPKNNKFDVETSKHMSNIMVVCLLFVDASAYNLLLSQPLVVHHSSSTIPYYCCCCRICTGIRRPNFPRGRSFVAFSHQQRLLRLVSGVVMPYYTRMMMAVALAAAALVAATLTESHIGTKQCIFKASDF